MKKELQDEQEDNFRVKKSDEFLKHCRELENQARIALADAMASTKRASKKKEELFLQCQDRAVARRKSGAIIVNPGY